MTELYLNTMDAIWALTPETPIFFIEGGGQGVRNVLAPACGLALSTACLP